MFAGRDECTVDAEHQRQQRRHIHVVYGPPSDRYARFAMPAMFGASAAEVRALLINSCYFWSFLDGHVHISNITPSFNTGIFALYLSGKWSEASLFTERERQRVLGRLLTTTISLPIGSFTPQKIHIMYNIWIGTISNLRWFFGLSLMWKKMVT